MNILYKKLDTENAATMYNMIKGANRKAFKEFVSPDDIMHIAEYVVYEDVNNDGDVVTIASIKDDSGDIYVTNGATFIRDFCAILDMCKEFGETCDKIQIVTGTSKKGRTFKTCVMC